MSSCSGKFLLHWSVVDECGIELEESSWAMLYLTFITHETQAAASPSSVRCETLWAMLTEEAWSNHWLLILRKVRPPSLPSNAMDRAFFKLLSGGHPGASHLDISIKQGSVWICICPGGGETRWLGGEAAQGKGPEEFCYCEEKRLVAGLFSGGRGSHFRIVLPHSGSTLLSATPTLPLILWTPSSLQWWLL